MELVNIGTYSFGMKRGLSTQEKLKRATECGYTGVELLTKDLEENTVEELKQWLAENHLSCVSYHGKMEELETHIPVIAQLGGRLAVCPRYAMESAEDAKECARLLNEKAKFAAGYSLKIGYHNHRQEFTRDENGKYLIETLLENTNPGEVFLQVDVGWAAAAGADCAAFLQKYRDRICAVHVKEWDGEKQCRMGDTSSVIDWKKIKEATDKEGPECLWIVEREEMYRDSVEECLKEDCEWLKSHL